MSAPAHTDLQAALDAEQAQRIALQHHAADMAQRVAELEAEVTRITECGRAHIRRAACLESERDTARGALRELERQVFALQQQRDVLQTCLDRHQRDAADPPGYLQDAVIRAAGLGALHEQRDAAIKERDELRARLAEIKAQPPVAWIEHELQGTGLRHLHFERRPNTLRDEVVDPVWTELIPRPAPAQRVSAADELAPAAAPDEVPMRCAECGQLGWHKLGCSHVAPCEGGAA